MPDTTGIIADLNDLLQLDHDAVEAYTVAIDRVRSERYRETLVQYRNDHKRHIEELSALVRARGGLPVELPHPTGALKLVVQALGSAGTDATLLLAFKAVEGQARDKYRRFAGESSYPEDVRAVVVRAAEDETRHYAWVEQTLRELGAGTGTVQHAAASAIEMVHKFIADPLERAERDLMRAVGSVVGTTKTRGGAAAPSPTDAMSGAASAAAGAATGAAANTAGATERVVADSMQAATGAKPADKGDALRFVAALHALEESGDVEGIVSLFDESAEISNPNDLVPHRGAEGARHFWRTYRDSFEEIHSDFSRIVEREGTAMLEWTSTGRIHGHPVTYAGVSVVEMADGRVKRFRAYFDPAKLQEQLSGE